MPDLKLKRLSLRNWAMIRAADIEFPDQGLVLVVGDNKSADGFMQSVGSGKTSLGEGLCRALLGCNARSSSIVSYSTHKKGDTYLQVEAEVRGTPLKVELGYKCREFQGSGEALRYTFGDQPAVQRATLTATRQELDKIVNITSRVADWTVLVDGDRIKFNQVSQADSVDLVLQAMNQPAWTDFYARAKKVVDELKVEHDTAVNTRRQLLDSLEPLNQRIAAARAEITAEEAAYNDCIQKQKKKIASKTKELEALRKEIDGVDKRRAEIARRIDELTEKNAQSAHQVEIKINTLNDELREKRKEHSRLVAAESSHEHTLSGARRRLKEMQGEPDECPKCGKPWDKTHGEDELKKAEAEIQRAHEAHQNSSKQVTQAEEAISELEAQIEEQKNKLKTLDAGEVKKLSQEDKDLELDLRDINEECRDAEIALTELKAPVSDKNLELARGRLQERLKQKTDNEQQIKKLGDDVVETQEALKAAQYWRVAFGPTGIPNMILEDAVKPLNEVSVALSKRMTGGVLAVTYSTTRQLATGRAKSELIIEVDNKYGSADVKMGSKGECGLTNFFMSETLGEVGSVADRVGFKWYDEVVPHHDGTLCRTIYGYMKEQAHRNKMLVFLVDHNPVAENFADHILVVEKGAESSRVYWR